MPSMVEITCKCGCKQKKMVRTVDVKRGWGKFFSKSCKAKWQERRTRQYRNRIVGTVNGVEVGPGFSGMTDQDHDQAMFDCTSSHGQDDSFR